MVTTQNEEKRASRVTANAGITSRIMPVIFRLVIGATTMPAKPASTEPSIQVPPATVLSEYPRMTTPSSESAAERISRPQAVRRENRLSRAARISATTSKIRRSRPTVMPRKWIGCDGSSDGIDLKLSPNIRMAAASATRIKPRVATSLANSGARVSGFMTTRWITAPITAENARAMSVARPILIPRLVSHA